MKTYKKWYLLLLTIIIIGFIISITSYAGDRRQKYKDYNGLSLKKTLGHQHRKSGFHDGNKIRCLFTNFGSI